MMDPQKGICTEWTQLEVDASRDATETFGPLHQYGIHGDNDNALDYIPKFSASGGLVPDAHRTGQFMQTFSGRKFWPLDARVEDVEITDIAHSLSMQCRYAGHCIRFYSVAEHSVIIAQWLLDQGYGADVALCGLLHDSTEAYLVDLPRPVKADMQRYKQAEIQLWRIIAEVLDLPEELPAIVHEADDRILADEIAQNMRWMPWHDEHKNPLGVELEFWGPEHAEAKFLKMFVRLVRQIERVAA